MPHINHFAVLSSAVAAFVIGGLWYSPLLFGPAYATLRGVDPAAANQTAMPVGEIVWEFVRWLIVAFILARVMALLAIDNLMSALAFGGWMWVAMYAALAGSVLHEGYPWRVYLIHAGDGLVKVAVITAILGVWRGR